MEPHRPQGHEKEPAKETGRRRREEEGGGSQLSSLPRRNHTGPLRAAPGEGEARGAAKGAPRTSEGPGVHRPWRGGNADGSGGREGLGGQREPEGDAKEQEGGLRGATESLLRRERLSPSRGDLQAAGRGGSRRRPIGGRGAASPTPRGRPRGGASQTGLRAPRRSQPPQDPPVPQPGRKVGGFLGSSLRRASRAPTWSAGRGPLARVPRGASYLLCSSSSARSPGPPVGASGRPSRTRVPSPPALATPETVSGPHLSPCVASTAHLERPGTSLREDRAPGAEPGRAHGLPLPRDDSDRGPPSWAAQRHSLKTRLSPRRQLSSRAGGRRGDLGLNVCPVKKLTWFST
ncbi:unnamed protein product [Rangifer tarandus platyrhynchus]|uniref:Uncharacterized protein n=1 Tax=Rangifer tarandus platyrhynchus TaxID=3082113 RepID=A0AC59YPQ4_RANTA